MFTSMRFYFIVLAAVILPKIVLTFCPNLDRQTSRSDICSKYGSYINGSVTSADGCFKVIAGNDCSSEMLQWKNSTIPYGQNVGLHLNAFDAYDRNGSFRRFALNITISEPMQQPVWFVFEDFIKPQNAKCFTLIKNITKPECDNVLVNYDCSVRDTTSSLMTSDSYTIVRFIINGEKIKYKLKNLYGGDMSNRTIFFYTHTSIENQLVITFQAIGDIQNYIINLCYKGQMGKCSNTFKVNLLENSTYSERFADLVTYKISRATLKKGKYKLYIDCQRFSNSTASSPDVDCCNQSRIFDIDIDHQFDLVDVAILIGLILIIGSSTFAITVLYLRRRVLEPIASNFKMLLVFDAVSVQHTEYVKATRIFLRKLLDIEVIVDVVDMPNKEHTSPYQWNITTIKQADCVAIVIPPKILTCERRGSPYHRTYQLCLNMLESHYENLLKTNQALSSDKMFTLALPFSDIQMIPKFAKFVARFQIPFDYFSLRQHIQSIQNPHRIRLPRWLLFNQTTTNKIFSTVVNNVQTSQDQIALLLPDTECSNTMTTDHDGQTDLLPEEVSAIHHRKEELEAIFGNYVTSIRNLPPVMSSTNC